MKKEMSIMAQKSIYNDDFYLTETFIYKVEGKVYEKDDCEVIDDCEDDFVDENLESKLKLLKKALENNKAIMNSLEKQLDKELKNI